MRSYKIESYVPEETFLSGKDARFCRAAFENCFVVDVKDDTRIIAACRKGELIGTSLAKSFSLSMAETASLINLFNGSNAFLTLPCPAGTLLAYPAWPHLEFALVFLLKENIETVEKAHQNAQRYAFSAIFDAEKEGENDPQAETENKLRILDFYMDHLFGAKRETNVTAQILMIANLVGCKLHEMSVSRISVTLDEREMERMSAYLFCTFMTMRRYNGEVSTSAETEENTSILTHAPQEYGIRIQQSVSERVTKPTEFDLPTNADVASFAGHPAFAQYKAEQTNGTLRLHLPLRQKALLSSISARGAQNELVLTLFPIS